jgi:hypothetical protein
MPNRLTKISLLCACALVASSVALAQHGGVTSYSPPPKIDPSPLPFRAGTSITVNASAYKPDYSTAAAHPPRMELRVVEADSGGNPPATGGQKYYAAARTPNWAHWSPATFTGVQATTVDSGHTLAMVLTYQTWSAVLRRYMNPSGSTNHGLTAFRQRCGTGKFGVCVYDRIF